MKRLLALIAGGLGVRALLRRRARPAPAPSPAENLRAKLAATRSQEPEPTPPAGRPGDEPQDVAARRADVHERARRAIDELDT